MNLMDVYQNYGLIPYCYETLFIEWDKLGTLLLRAGYSLTFCRTDNYPLTEEERNNMKYYTYDHWKCFIEPSIDISELSEIFFLTAKSQNLDFLGKNKFKKFHKEISFGKSVSDCELVNGVSNFKFIIRNMTKEEIEDAWLAVKYNQKKIIAERVSYYISNFQN